MSLRVARSVEVCHVAEVHVPNLARKRAHGLSGRLALEYGKSSIPNNFASLMDIDDITHL